MLDLQQLIDEKIIDNGLPLIKGQNTNLLRPPSRRLGAIYSFKGNYADFIKTDGFYIYKLTNLVTSKIYIGYTASLYVRMNSYLSDVKRGDQRLITKSIRKHSPANFSFEIILRYENQIEMEQAEGALIRWLKTNNVPNYNIDFAMRGAGTKSSYLNGKAKLNRVQVESIFFQYHNDLKCSVEELASAFKVSKQTIKGVLYGKRYKIYTQELVAKYGAANLLNSKKEKCDSGEFRPGFRRAKLKESDIPQIYQMYYEKRMACWKIAAHFDVTTSGIAHVLFRGKWKFLTDSLNEKYKSYKNRRKAKFKSEEFEDIFYQRYVNKLTIVSIAAKYNVEFNCIASILKAKYFKNITEALHKKYVTKE